MNGYIFIVNNRQKYLDLLDVAVDSVLSFSDKPIEVHGINFDYKSNNSRIKSKRINVINENFDGICYCKYDAMLNSEFDTGVYLDTDIIASRNTDKIFDYQVSKYPLLPTHPQDIQDIGFLMNLLGVKKKTQIYLHASICLFNRQCRPFLNVCKQKSEELLKRNITSFAGDEGLTNCLLWKENVTETFLPLCDPHYQDFEDKLYNGRVYNNVLYYTSHACKDVARARKILNALKEKNGEI